MASRLAWVKCFLVVLTLVLIAIPQESNAQGLDVVGRSDLGGQGLNGEVAVVGNTAVVASGILPGAGTRQGFYNPYPCPENRVKVVDLSTPGAPRVASTIPVPAGVVAFDVAALTVSTPSFTGDLAAVALVVCGSAGNFVDRGVAYYDVTDRAAPRFLGRYDADFDLEEPGDPPCGPPPAGGGERCASSQHQVALVQRSDGRVLSLSTEPFASASSFASGDLRIVDVTNPSNPTQIASFPNGPQQPPRFGSNAVGFSHNGCRPFDAGYGPAATPDGRTGLLAYLDQGVLTLNLADPASPSTLGQFGFPRNDRAFEGHAAYVDFASVSERSFALIGESDWIAPNTTLRIDAPASVAGSKFACEAMFTLFDPENTAQVYRQPGSQVPGQIVYVGRGCPTDVYLTPEANVAGKIVLRDRNPVLQTGLTGVCSFAAATKHAQDRGAHAVLVAQTTASTPEAFAPDGDPAGLSIPTATIDKPDADALRTTLCPTYSGGASGTCSGGQTVTGALVDAPGAWGALRRVDITNPAAPSDAGEYRTAESRVFPPKDLGVYSAHHAVARGGLAYAAWYSDGLRVIDITGTTLREVASFVPRDSADPTGTIPAKAYVTGVALTPAGDIVITDINSGLYVLRATGPGVTGLPGPSPEGICVRAAARLFPGTPGNDRIDGTPDVDQILAGTGNDIVDALAGNDCVDLGGGSDRGEGGSGNDIISSGTGNDVVAGSRGRDLLNGSSGNDRLTGGTANDRIVGGRGHDRLSGGSGSDRFDGGSSGDRISGNSGNDRLIGGSGADRLSGGSGRDRISALDGRRDRLSCGRGRDAVVADRFDIVSRDCERVRRRSRRR